MARGVAMKATDQKIIINGVTESGERFRPSDWAERVSGRLSTINNQRIIYSQLLQPAVRNGNKCIVIDPALQHLNPSIYNSVMAFATSNNLKIDQ